MKYRISVMQNVRESLGLEPDDTSRDSEIEAMPRKEVFRRWLEWEGIINWTSTILQVVENVYGIKLSENGGIQLGHPQESDGSDS